MIFKQLVSNTTQAGPRVGALLDDERAQVERAARSLQLSEADIQDVLAGVDRRHRRTRTFLSDMLAARTDLYRALSGMVGILIEQFGRYTVNAEGQFSFTDQKVADRYNAAARSFMEVTKRVDTLQQQIAENTRVQQEKWKETVAGQ